MIFLNPAPGQELENAHYFEDKGSVKLQTHQMKHRYRISFNKP